MIKVFDPNSRMIVLTITARGSNVMIKGFDSIA